VNAKLEKKFFNAFEKSKEQPQIPTPPTPHTKNLIRQHKNARHSFKKQPQIHTTWRTYLTL